MDGLFPFFRKLNDLGIVVEVFPDLGCPFDDPHIGGIDDLFHQRVSIAESV